jgi:pyrroloquinoline-quinone synthase
MQAQDTLDRLDRLIQFRSILRHPFYVTWQRGELTAEQLAIYARAYYPHVASFPATFKPRSTRGRSARARRTRAQPG